jgi:cell division protein FtsB
MWTRQRKRTRRSRLVLPALTVVCLAYFGFHAFHGSYGLYSKEQLDVRKADLTAELASLTRTRESLERQVALLQDGSIERDMLDEQARLQLNYSQKRDLTILTGDNPQN